MSRHDRYVTRLARQADLQVEEHKLEEEKCRAEEAKGRDCIKQEKEAEKLRLREEKIKCQLEEKRQEKEAKARAVEELKRKKKEEHLRKEALKSQLEETIDTLQEKRAVLELARQATDDELQQVGRDILLAENEKKISGR